MWFAASGRAGFGESSKEGQVVERVSCDGLSAEREREREREKEREEREKGGRGRKRESRRMRKKEKERERDLHNVSLEMRLA